MSERLYERAWANHETTWNQKKAEEIVPLASKSRFFRNCNTEVHKTFILDKTAILKFKNGLKK